MMSLNERPSPASIDSNEAEALTKTNTEEDRSEDTSERTSQDKSDSVEGSVVNADKAEFSIKKPSISQDMKENSTGVLEGGSSCPDWEPQGKSDTVESDLNASADDERSFLGSPESRASPMPPDEPYHLQAKCPAASRLCFREDTHELSCITEMGLEERIKLQELIAIRFDLHTYVSRDKWQGEVVIVRRCPVVTAVDTVAEWKTFLWFMLLMFILFLGLCFMHILDFFTLAVTFVYIFSHWTDVVDFALTSMMSPRKDEEELKEAEEYLVCMMTQAAFAACVIVLWQSIAFFELLPWSPIGGLMAIALIASIIWNGESIAHWGFDHKFFCFQRGPSGDPLPVMTAEASKQVPEETGSEGENKNIITSRFSRALSFNFLGKVKGIKLEPGTRRPVFPQPIPPLRIFYAEEELPVMLEQRRKLLQLIDDPGPKPELASGGRSWKHMILWLKWKIIPAYALNAMRTNSVGSAWVETIASWCLPSTIYFSKALRTLIFYMLSYFLTLVTVIQAYALYGGKIQFAFSTMEQSLSQNFLVIAVKWVVSCIYEGLQAIPVPDLVFECTRFLYNVSQTPAMWLINIYRLFGGIFANILPLDLFFASLKSKYAAIRPLIGVVQRFWISIFDMLGPRAWKMFTVLQKVGNELFTIVGPKLWRIVTVVARLFSIGGKQQQNLKKIEMICEKQAKTHSPLKLLDFFKTPPQTPTQLSSSLSDGVRRRRASKGHRSNSAQETSREGTGGNSQVSNNTAVKNNTDEEHFHTD